MSDELCPELVQATRTIMACRKCRQPNAFNGKGPKLHTPWAPPCGWAGLPKAGETDLVLVALNPGHPIRHDTPTLLGLKEDCTDVTDEQAKATNSQALALYRDFGHGVNSIFHKKSVILARALLWLMDGKDPGEDVWRRCWFTDAFKCITAAETAPRIPAAAFAACREHLRQELSICGPKVVVALGRRAFKQLRHIDGYPVVHFRHPSNGCPKLQSSVHDRGFEIAAKLLGVSHFNLDRFRPIRRSIHHLYFGG